MPTLRARDPDARWVVLAVAGLLVSAAILRWPGRAAEDLWFDEIFSLVLASQELPELIRRALADQTNPPGFYLLLWIWTRLGSVDTAWVRALPAIAGTLTVPAVILLARALGGRWSIALLTGLLAAVSPLLLAMSVEVRAYAPLALLTAVTLALAARLAGREVRPAAHESLALAGLQVALVSLHYFGALVVLAVVVATRWSAPQRSRTMFLVAVPAAIALLTWIGLVLVTAGRGGVGGNAAWIASPGLGALSVFGSQVIGSFGTRWGAWTVALPLAAAIALAAHRAWSTAPATLDGPAQVFRARWLLVTALLPATLALGLSLASPRSVWVARYLIILLPPLWLLVADATLSRTGRARPAAAAALIAWASLAGLHAERARPQRPAWSRIVRAFAGGAPATVCVNEPFVGLPLQFYAVAERAPLTVLPFEDCAAGQEGTWALLRPETNGSLATLQRAGARLEGTRPLGTVLPATEVHRLHWR